MREFGKVGTVEERGAREGKVELPKSEEGRRGLNGIWTFFSLISYFSRLRGEGVSQ